MTEEELKAQLEELKAANAELKERIGTLERTNKDLIEQRAELKEKIKNASGDEELKKELEAYKAQLEKVEQDKDAIRAELTEQLAFEKLSNQVGGLGIDFINDFGRETVIKEVLAMAKFEDGEFKFLKEDGTTKFNEADKPYSVIDAINAIRETDKGVLIKQPSGGGASGAETPSAPKTQGDEIDRIRQKFGF